MSRWTTSAGSAFGRGCGTPRSGFTPFFAQSQNFPHSPVIDRAEWQNVRPARPRASRTRSQPSVRQNRSWSWRVGCGQLTALGPPTSPATDRHRSTRSTAHPALPHRADPSGASAARYSCNSAPAWHAQDGTRTLPRQPFTLILDRVKLSLFAVQRFSRLPIRLYGMYRQGQPSVSNDFDFYDRSAHPISSLPQPLTNYDQALDVVLLLARTDTTVHNPHSQWCHGGVESGQLGQEFPIFPDHRDRPRAPLSARTGFPNAAASCTSSLPPLAWQVHMDGTQSRGPPGWWKRGRRPGVGRTPACRSAWHWVP